MEDLRGQADQHIEPRMQERWQPASLSDVDDRMPACLRPLLHDQQAEREDPMLDQQEPGYDGEDGSEDELMLDDDESFDRNLQRKTSLLLWEASRGAKNRAPRIPTAHKAVRRQGRGGKLSCVSLTDENRKPCCQCSAIILANKEIEITWQNAKTEAARHKAATQRVKMERKKEEREHAKKQKEAEAQALKAHKAALKEEQQAMRSKQKEAERAE